MSVLFGLTNAAGAANMATSPVSIRLVVERTEVRAGTPIRGVAILTNSSKKSILVKACAADGWLFVGISSTTIIYNPAIATVACAASMRLKPGANRFKITVSTSYQVCSQVATKSGVPRCIKSGMPPLPDGRYLTTVEILGLPSHTPHPTSIAITLT